MMAETPILVTPLTLTLAIGDENASNTPLTFKCVSRNYNLFHKAESAGRMSDARTQKEG